MKTINNHTYIDIEVNDMSFIGGKSVQLVQGDDTISLSGQGAKQLIGVLMQWIENQEVGDERFN